MENVLDHYLLLLEACNSHFQGEAQRDHEVIYIILCF